MLGFFNGDGIRFTHFDAALAAQAFVGVHRVGLFVFHLKDFDGAYIYTLFAAFAFILVYGHIKSHYYLSFKNMLKFGELFTICVVSSGNFLIPIESASQPLASIFLPGGTI